MQKIKIGIFGSSYSYHNDSWNNISWMSLLSQEFDITNYSLSGSSTYYSYKQFLDYHSKFDLIIFTVTHPFCLHTTVGPINDELTVKFMLEKFDLSYTEKKVLTGLKHYMASALLDSEIESQHIMFHNLMLEDIKRLRKEVIFIPSHSVNGTMLDKSQLIDITFKENEYWGITEKTWGEKQDRRQCHMSEPNNRCLYQKLKSLIDNNTYPCVLDFELNEISIPDNKEKYFFSWS